MQTPPLDPPCTDITDPALAAAVASVVVIDEMIDLLDTLIVLDRAGLLGEAVTRHAAVVGDLVDLLILPEVVI